MTPPFRHRLHGGQVLAGALAHLAGRRDVTVLGLAHDGVPVAAEVARALQAPLDVLLIEPVRHTLGPPPRDVMLGLVGFPPAVELHEATVNALGLSESALRQAVTKARRRLRQRLRALRPPAYPPPLHGRIVLVVDDGVAAGRVLGKAAGLVSHAGASSVVAAVPVGTREGLRLLASEYDGVVCPCPAEPYVSLPSWYEDARPVSDAEVRELLHQAWVWRPWPSHPSSSTA